MIKNKWNNHKLAAESMAFLMVCLFLLFSFWNPVMSYAKDSFLAGYMQSVYNQKSGIGSNEVNCLFQSSSGYIWAGTDGGLYRSNGSGFQSIDLWDTDRTDLYSINCIMQDQDGRMWIGTDNYGLFYIEDGQTHHLQEEYYNGNKTILAITEGQDGTIYVACTSGLFVVAQADQDKRSDTSAYCLAAYSDAVLASMEFRGLTAKDDEIWGLAAGGKIYVFNQEGVLHEITEQEESGEEWNTIQTCQDYVYVGSSGREVRAYRTATSKRTLQPVLRALTISCRMQKADCGCVQITGMDILISSQILYASMTARLIRISPI